MCELLPPISEDASVPADQVLTNSKMEQLMMTMLDEKDKLMDDLQKAKEDVERVNRSLVETQADNKALTRQLKVLLPQDDAEAEKVVEELKKNGIELNLNEGRKKRSFAEEFYSLSKDLVTAKKQVSEKEEELKDLKAERNNTRLLVEHLESLVSRHEKSLRMTVVKRQSQNPAGVSSEVEVLKALKSLFDHHQALDNKVKVRLRNALEQNSLLEDDLMLSNQEIKSLQDENRRYQKYMAQRSSIRLATGIQGLFTKDQRAVLEEKEKMIGDLQFSLDEQTMQLEETARQRDEVMESAHVLESEMELMLKELHTKQQSIKSSNKHISDAVGIKRDLEMQINELKLEVSREQTEVSRLRDHNSQVCNQLSDRENIQVKLEEELSNYHSEINQLKVHLEQSQEQSSDLLQQQTEILTQAEARQGSAESRVQELECDALHKQQLLTIGLEKEHRNEAHIEMLSATVERMLKESNERLTAHLTERITLTNDKDTLLEKVEQLQKDVDIYTQEKCGLANQVDTLKAENQMLRLRHNPSTTSLYRARSNQFLRRSWHEPELERRVSAEAGYGVNMTLREEESASSDAEVSTPVPAGEDESQVTRRPRPVSGNKEVYKLQQEEEEFWQLAEGFNMSKPGSVERYFDMLGNRVNQLQANVEDKQTSVQKSSTPPSTSSSSTATQSTDGPAPEVVTLQEFISCSSPVPAVHEQYRHIQKYMEPIPKELSFPAAASGVRERPHSMETIHKLRERTGGISNSVSRLFRRKHHKRKSRELQSSDMISNDEKASSLSPSTASDTSLPLRASEQERRKKFESLEDVYRRRTPFALWDTKTVIAWLEVWVGLPSKYVAACKVFVKSGAIMANLSDSEIAQELSISNSLHRLKIRLAVQEMVKLTSSSNKLYRTTSSFGEMGHEWISQSWLPSLGLPQYGDYFSDCLVDARMLEHLSKKDLRIMLKMVDSTQRNSLQYGIAVLKKLDYNRQELDERRQSSKGSNDILVWTNEDIIQWLNSVGMEDYTINLLHSGVHGGLIALDTTFDHEKLAMALQIPTSNISCRKLLKGKFNELVLEATGRVLTSPEAGPVHLVRSLSKRLKKRRFQDSDSSQNGHNSSSRAKTPTDDNNHHVNPKSSNVQRSSSIYLRSNRNSNVPLETQGIDGVTSVSL